MQNSQTVVFQMRYLKALQLFVNESAQSLCPPDVVRTLLSILELEGPFLTTVGAQL